MRVVCLLLVLLLVPSLGSCRRPDTQQAVVLSFSEQEPGLAPYATRMIVTPQYLRIDDGDGTQDFVLFDRRQQTIFSTNSLDKRVLVIAQREVTLTSPVLRHRQQRDVAAYPAVGGKTVVHYQYFTNDQLCLDVFHAVGLLPLATQALVEYYQVLAGEQASALNADSLPLHSACDLANNVFSPLRHLEAGFPIRYQDMRGVRRELTDYREGVTIDPAWFVLPQDYEVFTTQQLRGQ